MKDYSEIFANSNLSNMIAKQIKKNSKKKIKIMEVCGTHTVSIFKNGIRSLLPSTIELCSGPGCPVCVTSQDEIDFFISLSKEKDVILTTFGDLLRVPGSETSLEDEKAHGADIRIVYSTFDALEIAKKNYNKMVVFLGIGFETTAPTVAASIMKAKNDLISNFCVASAHKTVPPALEALANMKKIQIDGFLLPGHVSVIIGSDAYIPFFKKNKIPSVIAGFESLDIMNAILILLNQINSGKSKLENSYKRAVTKDGNQKALNIVKKIFKVSDTNWRGIGNISNSGLFIKKEYKKFDAKKVFKIKKTVNKKKTECRCGEVITGIINPTQCKLYKTTCTPLNPIGPCMVSTEGTCAAFYFYSVN